MWLVRLYMDGVTLFHLWSAFVILEKIYTLNIPKGFHLTVICFPLPATSDKRLQVEGLIGRLRPCTGHSLARYMTQRAASCNFIFLSAPCPAPPALPLELLDFS